MTPVLFKGGSSRRALVGRVVSLRKHGQSIVHTGTVIEGRGKNIRLQITYLVSVWFYVRDIEAVWT